MKDIMLCYRWTWAEIVLPEFKYCRTCA